MGHQNSGGPGAGAVTTNQEHEHAGRALGASLVQPADSASLMQR
jgi:hypothetical protein